MKLSCYQFKIGCYNDKIFNVSLMVTTREKPVVHDKNKDYDKEVKARWYQKTSQNMCTKKHSRIQNSQENINKMAIVSPCQ